VSSLDLIKVDHHPRGCVTRQDSPNSCGVQLLHCVAICIGPRSDICSGAPTVIKYVRLSVAISFLLFSAVGWTQQSSEVGSDPELEAQAYTTLQRLFSTTPRAGVLRYQAKAILVFPDMLKAGLFVGAQGGKGVMFGPDGRALGYYTARAISYGLQAGGQTFSEAMFFMTDSAISYLANSDGWSIGLGPSVVVIDAGMARSETSEMRQSDVYAFIYGQQGLMAGLGVQGQKITRFNP
jgi:lipid-binding SYLF domain-containing protein